MMLRTSNTRSGNVNIDGVHSISLKVEEDAESSLGHYVLRWSSKRYAARDDKNDLLDHDLRLKSVQDRPRPQN